MLFLFHYILGKTIASFWKFYQMKWLPARKILCWEKILGHFACYYFHIILLKTLVDLKIVGEEKL